MSRNGVDRQIEKIERQRHLGTLPNQISWWRACEAYYVVNLGLQNYLPHQRFEPLYTV